MKNKLKLLLLLIISAGMVNSAKAQLYIRGGVGIGFGLNPSVIGTDITNSGSYDADNSTSTWTNTTKSVEHSPGEGIYPEIAIGYMINNNMGFDLGFSYASGFSATVTDSYDSTGSGGGISETGSQNSSTKYSFHSFLITPAFVITGNSDKKFVPYARMGLIISLASEIDADDSYGNSEVGNDPIITPTSNVGEYDAQTTGSVQLGVEAAVGVTYKLSNLIAIFGEVNVRAFNFKPNQTTITTDTYNGVSQLTTATTSETTTNYSNSITTSNTTVYSPGSPSQSILSSGSLIPANTVGITVGIKLTFGGKK